MRSQTPISRRTLLRGVGVAIALPWLESMRPLALASGAVDPAGPPKRMAFCFIPNGVHMPDWKPQSEGSAFELPWILEPLAPYRDELQVLTGLTHDKARANGDGPGDHARASAAFLTGVQPFKTAGANIRLGTSVDQIAAQHLGHLTRLPSLELGCEKGFNAGSCDSGYSCAYSANISWRSERTPMPKEVDPKHVFARLFLSAKEAENLARRNFYRRSILDTARGDADRLLGTLPKDDRYKLDEYLTSLREIEQRMHRSEKFDPVEPPAQVAQPEGIPRDYGEHLRLMGDMMVLAFQADITRIASFMFANAGSNRSYKQIEVPEGHHDLSHHGNAEEKVAKIRQINRYHIEQLAYILGRMKEIREGEGSLLDNTMLLYGSGISDGNRHNHDDLPVLLLGRGGGTLEGGRHVVYPNETPLANLFVAMLDRVGISVPQIGDSTGPLEI